MARRRWIMVGIGIVLGGYLTLTALTSLPQANTGDIEGSSLEGKYTLPSLEEVIQSVQDLDVQRVLRMYSEQHQQVPPSTPPVRVILSSTWRSGSTLLGEVLASHPGSYYHYEPLMPYGLQQLGPSHSSQSEIKHLLQDLLHCDYKLAEDYLKFAFVHHDMFTRNTRLWSMCSAMPRSKCYTQDTLSRLCSLFPVHIMKVVRVRLELLEPLLTDPHVRLVWLVRDPRAVMNSRTRSVSWCDTRACRDPGYLCSDLTYDFSTYLVLKEAKPDQVMLLRYEDWARDPYHKSKEVLKFTGLDFHRDVKAYLDDHLKSEEDEPWSTRHDPSTRVSRWMRTMSYEDVVRTQFNCHGVMKSLGYRVFASKGDMNTGNAVGLLNVP